MPEEKKNPAMLWLDGARSLVVQILERQRLKSCVCPLAVEPKDRKELLERLVAINDSIDLQAVFLRTLEERENCSIGVSALLGAENSKHTHIAIAVTLAFCARLSDPLSREVHLLSELLDHACTEPQELWSLRQAFSHRGLLTPFFRISDDYPIDEARIALKESAMNTMMGEPVSEELKAREFLLEHEPLSHHPRRW